MDWRLVGCPTNEQLKKINHVKEQFLKWKCEQQRKGLDPYEDAFRCPGGVKIAVANDDDSGIMSVLTESKSEVKVTSKSVRFLNNGEVEYLHIATEESGEAEVVGNDTNERASNYLDNGEDEYLHVVTEEHVESRGGDNRNAESGEVESVHAVTEEHVESSDGDNRNLIA